MFCLATADNNKGEQQQWFVNERQVLCLGTNDLLGHDGYSKSYPTSANTAAELA